MENEPTYKPEKTHNVEIDLNSNYVFKNKYNCFIAPHYREHPPHHKIKDRVVVLNDKG